MNQIYPRLRGSARAVILSAFVTSLAAGTLTLPVGLNPGDHYRLVFVTSGARNALSVNIADYDEFVTTTANGGSSVLAPLATRWLAIGTTSTVDAISHINLSSNVPIFAVNGLMVASGAADFWDGFHAQPISIDETGTLLTRYCDVHNDCGVWTGSDFAGTNAFANLPLGGDGVPNGYALLGRSDVGSESWIQWSGAPVDAEAPFYGISGSDLIVPGAAVPEPGTWSAVLLGMIGLFGTRQYRRAKRQR